jgi:alpha/beta superfamily hydrolase
VCRRVPNHERNACFVLPGGVYVPVIGQPHEEVYQVAEKRIFFDSGGLKIEGMVENIPGERGIVVAHPHSLYGGTMHNNVVRAVAHACREEGYSTLRFNFRGVEGSEGQFENGIGEQEDVKAALAYMSGIGKKTLDLAGYSFGAWVNALGLTKFQDAQRLIMVSPPVSVIDFSFLEYSPKIKLVICGSRDEFAEYKKVERMLPKWNEEAMFQVIQGADHFYSGYEQELIDIIGEFLSKSAESPGIQE